MVKYLFGVVAACFLLVSCNKPQPAGDGYVFGKPQYEVNEVTIKIVKYDSYQDVRVALKNMEPTTDVSEVMAFSEIKKPYNQCIIHMVDPKVDYQPAFIGHEFTHCLYGQWHTNNESRS